MKKILFMAVAILFMIACNDNAGTEAESGVKYRDLAADNLKGDVVSYEQTPYAVDSTKAMGEMDSCCTTITEYDENGNAVKNTSKNSAGEITSETVITRYPNGLFESMSSTAKGKSTGGFKTELGDDGVYTVAQAIDSNGNNDVYYTDIKMNEVGEVTSWKQYDKDSVFRQSGESVYDGHKFMSFELKDSLGNVKSRNSSKYNDQGEQIETSNTNITPDSTTTRVTKYTYEDHDENGNWTKRITWDENGKPTKMHIRKYTYRTKTE